jgi:hypothetical protein
MTRKRKAVSIGRHSRDCTVCAHPQCAEIEQDFVAWHSPLAIAEQYGLADQKSVYRHAHAFGLFPKRERNLRAALTKIIEKADTVEVTAAAVVAAIQAFAKINAAGQWVERSEHVNMNELFDRMTKAELEAYAEKSQLPAWFTETVGGIPPRSQEAEKDA